MLGRLLPAVAGAAVVVALSLAGPGTAHAQYRAHGFYQSQRQPAYTLELEPHLVAGLANPPGPGVGQGGGGGLRGSIVVSRDGFIPTANDSLAIGFGIDAIHYRGAYGADYFGTCVARTPGPAGTSVCTEVDTPGGPRNYLFVPLVLQWNFWLTDRWSAFVEPGIDLYFTAHHGGITPSLGIGGRFQLNDVVSLIFRLGWPTATVGVSFLL